MTTPQRGGRDADRRPLTVVPAGRETSGGAPGPVGLPEYQLGQRVWAVKSGDRGLIERVLPQRYASNLYRVVWDCDPEDTDWYSAELLTDRHPA